MTGLPELHTDRLILRPFRADDLDLLHAMWTNPFVRRYLWDDAIISPETVEGVLAGHRKTVLQAGIGYWLTLLRTTGQAAGFCGFRFIDETPDVELMYALLPEFTNQGIATESSLAALDYIWRATPFARVYARTDPPNVRSVGVMERLGMTHHSTTPKLITYFIDRPGPPSSS